MKIYLVRHGETIENKTGIHQGQALQGILSEKGINQAIKVADRLKVEKFDVIFSSDLGRASNTAKEIAKHHSDTPIHFVKELRERYTGEIGGKHRDEIDYNNLPKDAERDPDLQKRGGTFIDEIYQEYKDKVVLLVGHNTINSAIVSVIMDKSVQQIRDEIGRFQNASVSIVEIKEGRNHNILLLNCIEHLQEEEVEVIER